VAYTRSGTVAEESRGDASTSPGMADHDWSVIDVAQGTCSVDGCEKLASAARGWCPMHYRRWRIHGDVHYDRLPGPVPAPPHERILARVEKSDDGCWLFTGPLKDTGYASLTIGSAADGTRRPVGAHRVMYEIYVGPIPDGHDLHHKCGVRHCVNPAHVTPIDHAAHYWEHDPITARWGPRGGPCRTCGSENFRITPSGRRICRACHNRRSQAAYARKKAATR